MWPSLASLRTLTHVPPPPEPAPEDTPHDVDGFTCFTWAQQHVHVDVRVDDATDEGVTEMHTQQQPIRGFAWLLQPHHGTPTPPPSVITLDTLDNPGLDVFALSDDALLHGIFSPQVTYDVMDADRVTMYFVERDVMFSIVSRDVAGYRFKVRCEHDDVVM